jgi:hypothetical protein
LNEDEFIMVNVGKVAWLFLKKTPPCARLHKFGVVDALTLSGRRPSQMKMITLLLAAGPPPPSFTLTSEPPLPHDSNVSAQKITKAHAGASSMQFLFIIPPRKPSPGNRGERI